MRRAVACAGPVRRPGGRSDPDIATRMTRTHPVMVCWPGTVPAGRPDPNRVTRMRRRERGRQRIRKSHLTPKCTSRPPRHSPGGLGHRPWPGAQLVSCPLSAVRRCRPAAPYLPCGHARARVWFCACAGGSESIRVLGLLRQPLRLRPGPAHGAGPLIRRSETSETHPLLGPLGREIMGRDARALRSLVKASSTASSTGPASC